MSEAAWRRRLRAPSVAMPDWARDKPERLLYSSTADGKLELYAWDQAADWHRQVTNRPEGTSLGRLDVTGAWVWWFDDERGNEFGRWMRAPFEGGRAELAETELSPGYPAGLALAKEFAVIGLATDEGVIVWLVRSDCPARRLYTHREDASVAGLSRDETLLSMEHAEHGDGRHRAVRVTDLEGATVAEMWDGPGIGLETGPWSPRHGDNRLLVVHERSGSARPAVWEPRRGQLVELPMELPGEVRSSWYPDASALLLEHDHRGRTELYRYDLGTRALSRLEHPKGLILRARVRPDGEVWFDWSNGAEPSQVRSSNAVVFKPQGEAVPRGTPFQDLDVSGVHALLAEPRGARPHPTIFGIHGGPAAFAGDEFLPRTQAWVDHGYAVVNVNYRGSSGYGRAWRDALEGNPGFTELEDIVAVRAHVVAAGIADPARIILMGGSWGGYLTLLGLGTRPDLWSLGIAIAPVGDYLAAFEDMMEPERAYDRALFGGTPEERPDFYRERSPITYADRVRAPVFIVAGRNDPRCPLRQIENYVARMRELGKPCEYYAFDAGHSSRVVEETIRQLEAQLGFAARHLGTSKPM